MKTTHVDTRLEKLASLIRIIFPQFTIRSSEKVAKGIHRMIHERLVDKIPPGKIREYVARQLYEKTKVDMWRQWADLGFTDHIKYRTQAQIVLNMYFKLYDT